jgi:ABC-type antimicrobial peptide transport system permease subunit
MLVRSMRPTDQVVAGMRQTISAIDPSLPVYGAGSLEQMLGFAMFPSRAAAIALTAFGLLAVVLAATGIHGLVAYAVSKRQREIGIRIAMGASRSQILRVVLGRLAMLLSVGAAVGLVLAVAAGRLLATIVYQASPGDPAVLGAVVVLFLAIGALSCLAPALRSLRTEPMHALRPE